MTKYYIQRLEDDYDKNLWVLNGIDDECDGIVYEDYGTMDELITELKGLKVKAFILKDEKIMELYSKSSKIHSFYDYNIFLTPIKI